MKIVRKLSTGATETAEEAKVAPEAAAKVEEEVAIEVHSGAEESAPAEEEKKEAKAEAKEAVKVAEAPKPLTEAEAKAEAAPKKKKAKAVVAEALAAKANKPVIKKVWDEEETSADLAKKLSADIEDGAADVVELFKKAFEARLSELKNDESIVFCGIKFTKTRVNAKFNSFNRPNQLVYYTTAYEMIDAKRNGDRTTISAVGDKASKTLKPPFCIKNDKDEWVDYKGDLIKEATDAYPEFCDRSEAVNQKNLADAQRRIGK
jgi:uncharacterized membrane protein YqiK